MFHPDAAYQDAQRAREIPLSLYFWNTGTRWKLKDLTNPNNTFEDEAPARPGETEPPASLFQELDYKGHFPRGVIHYQIPGGRGGQVKTTERMTLSDWLLYIGLGVAAIGLGLATFGAGTVVVMSAYTLAGVLTAASAGAHMAEEAGHGNLSAGEAALDIAQIVAGLAGASQLVAGGLVMSAEAASQAGNAWKGTAALVAKWAQAGYVPLTVGRITGDVVTVALAAPELARQLDAIENSGAPVDEKSRLKTALLLQFAVTGGLVALSIKGDLPAITGGKKLYVYATKDGVLTAVHSAAVSNWPLMDQALARARGTGKAVPGDTAVLDALGDVLSEAGKPEAAKGLQDFRAKLGDANARRALDSEARKGNDLAGFLTEKGMTPEARAEAHARAAAARATEARSRLSDLHIDKDPHLQARLEVDLAELAKKLTDEGIAAADQAGIRRIVDGYNVTELVGEIGEAIARADLRTGAAPGQIVLSNIEIVRELPGFKTIAEWKAAEQVAGRPGDVGGLYEAGGKLWKSVTEVDNMVVEPGAGGKLRIVDLEQTKVGGTHVAATAQNTKAMAGLGEIAAGNTEVQIFDRVGKNKLGAQRTGEFDVSSLAATGQHTRGLPGNGFDRKLPFDKVPIEELARQLLRERLPEVGHPSTPPTVDRNH